MKSVAVRKALKDSAEVPTVFEYPGERNITPSPGYCSIRPVIRLPVPNILTSCKAEEEGDAVASLTDDNAAGDKIGGVESLISGRMEQYVIAEKERL